MQYIIIGAGPAGITAAETLRRLEPRSSVTVVGEERCLPYSRMALPYYLINRIDEAGTLLRQNAAGHYTEQGIDLLQARVNSVDTEGKQVHLEKGERLAFDRLLIATGAYPLSPPIPGLSLPAVQPCWTLEHARSIMRLAQPGSKIVLMGAGFIGCILLEALVSRGVELTVIEMGDRMVPRMMNQVSGGLIKQWCMDKKVAVHTSTRVEAIEEAEPHALAIKLDSGDVLAADLLISAVGVRANIEFLAGSGVATDFGVLVDHHLQSSHPDVFAAGDVCQGKDFSTGEYTVQAIQPTAVEHGRIAAMNMANRVVSHPGSVNMNVLDTMGLIASSYGLWMGVEGGDSAEVCDRQAYRYLNLQFQDDVLVGAQSLGLTQHIGVLRGLIQSKVKLGKWKKHLLRDPSRLMEAYLGATQAIGFNARRI